MKVRIEPEARTELRQAKDWYEHQRSGLGAEFLEAARLTMDRVRENPFNFPFFHEPSEIRRALVERFPYVVVYLVHQRAIRILVIAHQRRDPAFLANSSLMRKRRI